MPELLVEPLQPADDTLLRRIGWLGILGGGSRTKARPRKAAPPVYFPKAEERNGKTRLIRRDRYRLAPRRSPGIADK